MSEREEIEMVFSLGGGELMVEPWGEFAYWFDGVPEWAGGPSTDFWEMADEYELRTAIVCELFGQVSTPEGWERVQAWTSSGEAQCWHCEGSGRVVHGEGAMSHEGDCATCEGGGYVYLGEGWREVVFRRPLYRTVKCCICDGEGKVERCPSPGCMRDPADVTVEECDECEGTGQVQEEIEYDD